MERRAIGARVGPRVAAAGLAVGLGVATASAQAPGSVSLTVALPDEPTAGARLFVQKGCVRCHALGGDEVRMGPDLGRIHFPGTALELAGSFWNHAPVMAEKIRESKIQQPTLDSREMADLLAFLTAYRYYVAQVGAPANPGLGKKVFEQKGCATCHGEAVAFDKKGPSLTRYQGRLAAIPQLDDPIALFAAMWNHSSRMEQELRRLGLSWPRLATGEAADLAAFLVGARAAAPGAAK